MSWIEKLQKKSPQQKLKIVWGSVIVTAIVLVGAWILMGNVKSPAEKNLELFKTVDQGIKNLKNSKQ